MPGLPLTLPFSLPGGSPSSGVAIQDLVYNPLATPASGSMIGWQEEAAAEQQLALRIYMFLIEGIRTQDEVDGQLFLKRFLEGPQQVWEQTNSNVFALHTLWDITRIDGSLLKYLKRQLGWGPSTDAITEALTEQVLRRLIGASARLWKNRGSEDALSDVIGLVTGARNRVFNYFDWRWVTGETGLGHEIDGHDPWTIAIDDDRTFNLRVMDDGTLNRTLVRDLARLMRPMGERIEVNYLLALDMFTTDGDNSLWTTDDAPLDVADGEASLVGADDACGAVLGGIEGSDLWDNYLATLRVRGAFGPPDPLSIWGVTFCYQDAENHYAMYSAGSEWFLVATVAGVVNPIGGAPHPGLAVDPDEWLAVRVQVTPEAGQTRILIYVDGVEIFNLLDASFSAGPPGIIRLTKNGSVYLDQIEVMRLPVESETIDINS